MTSERDAVLELVRRHADKRPVRWTDSRTSMGDFDGCKWTVEIFDVAKGDRRALRDALWDLFGEVQKHTGKALSLVTHTPEDTTAHYSWVRAEAVRVGPTLVRGIRKDLLVTPRQHVRPREAVAA